MPADSHLRPLVDEVAMGVARPPHGCTYVPRRLSAGGPTLVVPGLPDFLVLSRMHIELTLAASPDERTGQHSIPDAQ